MATIQGLLDDFASETGITLDATEDSEQCEHEETYSSPGSDHGVGYRSIKWEERFAVVQGFSFTVDGITISGRLPGYHTYGRVDTDEGEVLDADEQPVLDAIRKVCGPINFGETALGNA